MLLSLFAELRHLFFPVQHHSLPNKQILIPNLNLTAKNGIKDIYSKVISCLDEYRFKRHENDTHFLMNFFKNISKQGNIEDSIKWVINFLASWYRDVLESVLASLGYHQVLQLSKYESAAMCSGSRVNCTAQDIILSYLKIKCGFFKIHPSRQCRFSKVQTKGCFITYKFL